MPIRSRSILGAFLGALFTLTAAKASAAGMILTNPDAIECKVISNPGYAACNLWYEGLLVHEGLSRGPAEAAGDCVICKNFKSAAKIQRMNIYVERSLNWSDEGFMTLTYDDTPGLSCN